MTVIAERVERAQHPLRRDKAGPVDKSFPRERPEVKIDALLVPLVDDHWEDLVRRGQVQPPVDDLAPESEPAADYGVGASEALVAARRDER